MDAGRRENRKCGFLPLIVNSGPGPFIESGPLPIPGCGSKAGHHYIPEGWQRLAGGRAKRYHRNGIEKLPASRQGCQPKGTVFAARILPPLQGGMGFFVNSGGVASLNHRLMVLIPPGSHRPDFGCKPYHTSISPLIRRGRSRSRAMRSFWVCRFSVLIWRYTSAAKSPKSFRSTCGGLRTFML